MKMEPTYLAGDGLENAPDEAAAKQRRYVERLDHKLHVLENTLDATYTVYAFGPPALRSKLLMAEIRELVGQRARVEAILNQELRKLKAFVA